LCTTGVSIVRVCRGGGYGGNIKEGRAGDAVQFCVMHVTGDATLVHDQ
jgi:hypothetical protein